MFMVSWPDFLSTASLLIAIKVNSLNHDYTRELISKFFNRCLFLYKIHSANSFFLTPFVFQITLHKDSASEIQKMSSST